MDGRRSSSSSIPFSLHHLPLVRIVFILLSFSLFQVTFGQNGYYGRFIGEFPPDAVHNVKGRVYAVNEDTIYIKGFHYDGAGPDAFFWAGSTPLPNAKGFIIPDELGRTIKLSPYKDQNVLLKLPGGRKLKDIRWLAVWCRKFTANFGHVDIPFDLDPPTELNLGRLPSLAHGTSADAVILKDSKTIQFRNLRYDGAAPDAFFLVGLGTKPHGNGIKVPDENGSLRRIHGYTGQDITIRLPGNTTVFDIEWIALYCITYAENFGSVFVPERRHLNIPADVKSLVNTVMPFMNCETMFDDLMQISWEIRQPDIYIQLEGRVDPDIYMAFGLSGDPDRPKMIDSDVTVVWYDQYDKRGKVVDYFITAKSQCAPQSQSGACPDLRLSGGREDSQLLSWNYADGILKVAYRRPLTTGDSADKTFYVDSPITTVAAIGHLNSRREAAYHSIAFTRSHDTHTKIFFNRVLPVRNCRPFINETDLMKEYLRAAPDAWPQSVIENEHIFRAQIGPAGGSRGYTAITGEQSWGIAWWINGLLIPEIHVRRGQNYTFIVEGGNDPSRQARYHPFYITNNREGGGGQEPALLRSPNHQVYAGIDFRSGFPDPSPGTGRYCEWKHKTVDVAEMVSSLEEYKRTLYLDCEEGQFGLFTWTPDENTPDVVYYQCFTHRNLGWKIIVSRGFAVSPPSLLLLTILSLFIILSSFLRRS